MPNSIGISCKSWWHANGENGYCAPEAASTCVCPPEHQQYSPENQLEVILQYTAAHGVEIVQAYSDHGKSGLNIAGRFDVRRGNKQANFLLCWSMTLAGGDASRKWTRAPITNTASKGQASSVLKTVKRAMAAKYSLELSLKVSSGQCRLIESASVSGDSDPSVSQ